jgi:hypothetical protein
MTVDERSRSNGLGSRRPKPQGRDRLRDLLQEQPGRGLIAYDPSRPRFADPARHRARNPASNLRTEPGESWDRGARRLLHGARRSERANRGKRRGNGRARQGRQETLHVALGVLGGSRLADACSREEPRVCRLAGGGNRIRTPPPACGFTVGIGTDDFAAGEDPGPERRAPRGPLSHPAMGHPHRPFEIENPPARPVTGPKAERDLELPPRAFGPRDTLKGLHGPIISASRLDPCQRQ